MPKLVDVSFKPIWDVINVLLKDKTTGKNVVWATDAYAARGPGYGPEDPITKSAFIGDDPVLIQPRIEKNVQEQQARTKKKAEVYTPSWLCNKMNNYCDAEWFGRPDVFNKESCGAWTAREEPVWFNEKKGRKIKEWQKYVDSRRLEITCGEAPFLVSRYDAATGDILPIDQRIGILDRKLRVVNENTASETEWLKWAQRAVESCYGYEFQGDSLLIARINVLMTFCEYYKSRWEKEPVKRVLKTVANIVAWNIWQMDGINDATPLTRIARKRPSFPLIEEYDPEFLIDEPSEEIVGTLSKIKNWRGKYSFEFKKLKETGVMKKKMKKFDFVIGNPPYQEDNDISVRKSPIYNVFMEEAYKISDIVELITPARFLFNAGQTPKVWNDKMLSDEHFKVLHYEKDATTYFENTDIKGGVVISLRDTKRKFGKISVFTPFDELNSILHKVRNEVGGENYIDSIVSMRGMYRLTDSFFSDFPDASKKVGSGTGNMIVSNIFLKIPEAFLKEDPQNGFEYMQILGRIGNSREYRYIRTNYVIENEYIGKYKLFFPEANSSGQFGETLSSPEIGFPGQGATDTFINIGLFESEFEVKALKQYIKTKFMRALLGVRKATQHTPRSVWDCIPLQDFTPQSDIDWTKTVEEIDRQLYKKYGLSQKEITFIETHVKEMN